ncbi:helix-turn-helix domain-containing protein [Brucella pseudogrignonensis]|uniref:Crp/Fnr family transcriptional regulator n=1 Tax=Brucella pseudogrignonensis TaxID=419475 RepID=UPI001E5C379E|nr:helix-turn-helix domain-containing protein [Brucella pseudogrignonensis]MCD4512084.1 helix-turn-helix domain-containing protein [Brucella pseudogrignonensis]
MFNEIAVGTAFLKCDGTVRTYSQNYTLINEGEKIIRVYTVNNGLLRAFRFLSDGRRQITHFLFPNDFVGLIDKNFYSKSIETVVPSELTSLSQIKLQEFLSNNEGAREALRKETRNLLRRSNVLQVILGRLSPIEKLSCFILLLHEKLSEANVVRTPMPRQGIADFLGMTIETVSRSFTRLRKLGIIVLHDSNLIEICSVSALQQVAGITLSQKN